jgi:hypothetical protein
MPHRTDINHFETEYNVPITMQPFGASAFFSVHPPTPAADLARLSA